MKRPQTIFIVAIVVSVFLLSFLIGRATALRDEAESKENLQIYNGTVAIPEDLHEESTQTSVPAQNVAKSDSLTAKEKETEETADTPPERMLFPCGRSVLKEYCETAVYSETMGDWRAHTGIDYEAEKNTDVLSAWDGTVRKIYKDKLWGHTVEIEHSGNLISVYKNLQSDINVKKGDKVKGG